MPKCSDIRVRLRRIRQPGDAETLKKKLWQAVIAAEDLLLSGDATFSDQIRAVHALQQACTAYAKMLEVTDLAQRIEQLEARLEAQQETVQQASMLRRVL